MGHTDGVTGRNGGVVGGTPAVHLEHVATAHDPVQEWLDAIPVPVFFKDVDGVYLGCNLAFEAYVGHPRDELVGKTVHDLWPPSLADIYEAADRQALSMSEPQVYEASVQAADGTLRTVEFHKTKLHDPDGRVTGLIGVIFDISARKAAETALREREELYRRVVQDQTEMVCRSLPDGTITFANDAYGRFIGLSPDDLIGTNIFSPMPDDVRATVIDTVSRLTPEHPTVRMELPALFRDGRQGWTEWVHRGFFDEAGRHIESQATGSDITTRKEAEREVERLRRQQETVLASVADGILVVDTDGNHVFVNPAAAAMLGYAPDKLVGRHSHSTWHHTRWDGSPYPSDECPIHAAQRNGEIHRGSNEPFWRKDGTHFPAEFVSAPVRDGDRIVGAVVTFRDITARRLAEEAQQMAIVGHLAAGVAHDLGSLLTAIKLTATLAKQEGMDCVEMADRVLGAAAEGTTIAKNLMGFARPNREPLTEVVRVEQVIDSALSVAEQRLRAGRVDVVRQYASDGLPIAVDRVQLGRVFLNLIINAGQAMPDGGTLTVGTHYPEDGGVSVTVADNGEGIAPDNLPRIFEPFFTTKQEGRGGDAPGTGLGLSVAHEIVTAYGGSISVESELGVGTTFEVRLPTVIAAPDTVAASEPE